MKAQPRVDTVKQKQTEKFLRSVTEEFEIAVREAVRHGRSLEELKRELGKRLVDNLDNLVDRAGIKDLKFNPKGMQYQLEMAKSFKSSGIAIGEEAEQNRPFREMMAAVEEYDHAVAAFIVGIDKQAEICFNACQDGKKTAPGFFRKAGSAIATLGMDLIAAATAVGITVGAFSYAGVIGTTLAAVTAPQVLLGAGIAVATLSTMMVAKDLWNYMKKPDALEEVMKENRGQVKELANALKGAITKGEAAIDL